MSYLPNIKYRCLRVRAIVQWSFVFCSPHIWQYFPLHSINSSKLSVSWCVCVSGGMHVCTWIEVSNNAGAASLACGWPHVAFVSLFESSLLSLSLPLLAYRHPFQCDRIPATKICMEPNFECNWIAAHKSPKNG